MSPATATAHAKVPFVGGGAFKDRDLANRALESEKRLRELMGMLLEAVLSGPLEKEEVSSAQEFEADDDEEWEDVDDDDDDKEDWEDVHDEDVWEDIDDEEDDEELEDVEDEDGGEDIDDDDDLEDTENAESALLMKVENLLVKWYHKDNVTALVKTLIESAQASYAEQEEFCKDRRIVQEWFGGIDK
ncbi:uncharacterized protein J4E78_008237 [Alternaria triticimaculans]|uniref:uncharacterized protein n=1 Tax=Alternaria triticimaculans TaxID=297637 RepID=UPI0020C4060D|nr:uncharacterized protein J4E78_008237 [Alternaria triticimaculans]KAI4649956.1 hypothetical protein J4E78_008237 [Alternaria triticimaculans]